MSIFENFLNIKTWRKTFLIKAVYIENTTPEWMGSYFLYYYDMLTHTFYINDLDTLTKIRTSAINVLEHIVNKAYKQEMNLFVNLIQQVQIKKIPKVFCIYEQKMSKDIIVDKIHLKSIIDENWFIIKFKHPKWESLDNTLKDLGVK